jgi:S-adenosylmethionine:tRNA ribosyltransferase-isomerase
LLLSDFAYDLPPERIAADPARPRDSARLLRVGANLSDHIVANLPALLRAGDMLVVNDTRVIPAQLTAWRGAARRGSESRWTSLSRMEAGSFCSATRGASARGTF